MVSMVMEPSSLSILLFRTAFFYAGTASGICAANPATRGTVLLVFLPGFQEILSVRETVSQGVAVGCASTATAWFLICHRNL